MGNSESQPTAGGEAPLAGALAPPFSAQQASAQPPPAAPAAPAPPRIATLADANEGIRTGLRFRATADVEVQVTPILRDLLRLAVTKSGVPAPKEGDRVPDAAALDANLAARREWLDWNDALLSLASRAPLGAGAREVKYLPEDLANYVENTRGASDRDFDHLKGWTPISAADAASSLKRWGEEVKGWQAEPGAGSRANRGDALARIRIATYLQEAIAAAAPAQAGGKGHRAPKRA